jgi:hypothetical protein
MATLSLNTISFNGFTNAIQIDGSIGDFVTAGFTVGQRVNVIGSQNNNISNATIASLTQIPSPSLLTQINSMVLSGVSLVYEEYGSNVTIST